MKWRIPLTVPDLPPLAGFQRDVARIFAARRVGNYGPFATRLEREAAAWTGAPTLTAASGDAALRAMLSMVRHSAIVVSDWTFQSTINSVIHAGLVPVIAGIDEDTLCVTPQSIRDATCRVGPSPVLATHAHGSTAAAAHVIGYGRAVGREVLFDAAHALRPGVPIGDGAAFSMSGTKVVTCGEGGLLALPGRNDAHDVTTARAFSNYGFWADYNAERPGINGKMAELPAALALRSMARFSACARRRLKIADLYRVALADVAAFQSFTADDVPKDFVVRFADASARIRAEAALTKARVETKRYFRPLSMQNAYAPWWPVREVRASSRALWDRTLCLPLSSRMTAAHAREVAGIVARAVD